jgi:hypothetical protein
MRDVPNNGRPAGGGVPELAAAVEAALDGMLALRAQIAALHAALKLHPPQIKGGGSDDMTVAHDQLDDAQRNLTRRISERVQEQASAVFVHVVEPVLERLTRIEGKLDNALSRISVLEASLPRRREGEYE